jgi:hypothetical protein
MIRHVKSGPLSIMGMGGSPEAFPQPAFRVAFSCVTLSCSQTFIKAPLSTPIFWRISCIAVAACLACSAGKIIGIMLQGRHDVNIGKKFIVNDKNKKLRSRYQSILITELKKY